MLPVPHIRVTKDWVQVACKGVKVIVYWDLSETWSKAPAAST